MNFFTQIKNSIYSPSYYTEIPKKSFGDSLKYFFALIFILSAIQATSWIYSYLTVGKGVVDKIADRAASIYPSELEIMIEDGQVSTNVEEPYYITVPELAAESANLLVIDTKTPYSSAKFNEYKTAVWLSKDSIFYKGNNKVEVMDLSKQQTNFVLNKSVYDGLVSTIRPYLSLITPVVVVGSILVIFIGNIFLLVYLLLLSALIFLLVKLLKKSLTFGQSYKVGLHAITLPLIITTLMDLVGIAGFSFMFTIIALVAAIINLAAEVRKA